MSAQKLIEVKEFCVHYNISADFIFDLQRYEMIKLVAVKRTSYIPENSLQDIERMIRLHHELQINIEGIQTIFHLLSRIEKNETALKELRNQLAFYHPAE